MSPGLLSEVYKRRNFAVLRLFSRHWAGTTRANGAVSVLRILRLDVHNVSLDIGTILRTNVVLNGCADRRASGIRRGRRRMRDPASASRSRPSRAPVKLLLTSGQRRNERAAVLRHDRRSASFHTQRNDASSHWMPVYFWGSMAADRLSASLSRLDRFISRASRADEPTKNLLLSLPAAGNWPRCY
jgi:hypothetical protein